MRALRSVVAGHDVFVWASDILRGLEHVGDLPRGVRGAERIGFDRRRPTSDAAR
jgi:hypothetical protein